MRTMILATVLLATVAMLLEPARISIRGEDALPLLARRPAPSVSVSTGGAGGSGTITSTAVSGSSTTAVLVPCGVQAGAMPGVCMSAVPR